MFREFLVRSVVVATIASAVIVPREAGAQGFCLDGFPLISPDSLSVVYVPAIGRTVQGNRLNWTDVTQSEGSCFVADVSDDIATRLDPQLTGAYVNLFDRRIIFTTLEDAVVGDTTKPIVVFNIDSPNQNPAAGNLRASLNLSNQGGVFQFTPEVVGNAATQTNEGIPAHLPSTDITAMAQSADGQVIYAAVRTLPIIKSTDGGLTWTEPRPTLRAEIRSRVRSIAVSANDHDRVFMIADSRGLFISEDGGATWTRDVQVSNKATPTFELLEYVQVLNGSGQLVNRLYTSTSDGGLFYSDDDGVTFQSVPLFDLPTISLTTGKVSCGVTQQEVGRVRSLVVSPNDPSRIYVGLANWGVYGTDTSTDHSVWEPRWSGLVLCGEGGSGGTGPDDSDRPSGEQRTVNQMVVLDNGGVDVLVVETNLPEASVDQTVDVRSTTTVFVSVDGAQNWVPKGDSFPTDEDDAPYRVNDLIVDPRPSRPLSVIAATGGSSIWELSLAGGPGQGIWFPMDFAQGSEIANVRAASLLVTAGGRVVVGTEGSGVYTPGTEIDLSRALGSSSTNPQQLGLYLSFGGTGEIRGTDRFQVVGQAMQAYAVWRADDQNPVTGEPIWKMIGLYDLTNPEFCNYDPNTHEPIPCDAEGLLPVPGCFANKRANCFTRTLREDGRWDWEFFDRDVFNGYTYWYAVSTLDYGFTGDSSPQGFNGDFVFSPRSSLESDPAALDFIGERGGQNYNTKLFQVNVAAREVLAQKEVFVVPNPLIRQAGFDRGDETSIRIVNVTATSRAQIFTLAGDLVAEVENVVFDGLERGNIEWDTRNADGQLVASGVYIYRVTDDDGNEVMNRFTIIR